MDYAREIKLARLGGKQEHIMESDSSATPTFTYMVSQGMTISVGSPLWSSGIFYKLLD